MALHFALRNKQGDPSDPLVYVLDPYRLMDTLNNLPETLHAQQQWAEHIKAHPDDADEDESDVYLPSSNGDERPFEQPRVPLVLQFPFISRRFAASQLTVPEPKPYERNCVNAALRNPLYSPISMGLAAS